MKKIDQKNPQFIRLWIWDFLPISVTYLSIFGQPKVDTGCHLGQLKRLDRLILAYFLSTFGWPYGIEFLNSSLFLKTYQPWVPLKIIYQGNSDLVHWPPLYVAPYTWFVLLDWHVWESMCFFTFNNRKTIFFKFHTLLKMITKARGLGVPPLF